VYAYSDTGYLLLGEIIERAAGAPLAEAYRTLLDFEGLHLDATYLESLEPAPPGIAARAHQYVGEFDGFDLDPSFDGYGPAGLVSTVDDLSTFYGRCCEAMCSPIPRRSTRCSRFRPATPRPEQAWVSFGLTSLVIRVGRTLGSGEPSS
jgi:CubicO group peptidase (beta-lactamase class C family)